MAEILELPGSAPETEGERASAAYLAEVLPDDWWLIPNRRVTNGGSAEIDIVVVGGGYVYAVEVKSWTGVVTGDDTGWYVRGEFRGDVVAKTRRSAAILKGWLERRDARFQRLWVQPMVVFTEPIDLRLDGGVPDIVYESVDSAAVALVHLPPSNRAPVDDATLQEAAETIAGLHARPEVRRFGHYEVLERLGTFGNEEHYLAHHDSHARDPDRLLRRIQLSHYLLGSQERSVLLDQATRTLEVRRFEIDPAIPRYVDWFETGNDLVIVEELVGGTSLREISRAATPTNAECRRLLHRLAAAICSLHRAGVGHGNIRPTSVSVGPDLDEGSMRIACTSSSTEQWESDVVTVSPLLREPESVMRDDINGWARCAIEVFDGPEAGYDPEQTLIPPPLQEVVERALDTDAAEPPSAADLESATSEAVKDSAEERPSYSEALGFRVVGIDLGHAETAISMGSLLGDDEPEPLVLFGARDRVVPTAVALDPSGSPVAIGEAALTQRLDAELVIAFKTPDNDDRTNQDALAGFVRLLWRQVTNKYPQIDQASAFLRVGCPAAWDQTTRDSYRDRLRSAGLSGAELVSESRAAFLQVRNSTHSAAFGGRVLIVDLGSSTADFTVVDHLHELPELSDHGDSRLGGILIDTALLQLAITRSGDTNLMAALVRHPSLQWRALLACRKAKEKYFDHTYWPPDALVGEEIVLRSGGDRFVFDATFLPSEVEVALDSPQPALAGSSWKDALRDAYHRMRERAGGNVDAIVLTGGAARMHFVAEMAHEVFGDRALVERSTAPDLDVACGLALAGRIDEKMRRFDAEVDELLASGVVERIARLRERGLVQAVTRVASARAAEAITVAFERWRAGDSGYRTLEQVTDAVVSELTGWFNSPDGARAIDTVARNWVDGVADALAQHTDPICSRYGLPRAAMQPPRVTVPLPPDLVHLQPVIDALGAFATVLTATITGVLLAGGGVALFQGSLMAGPLGPFVVFAFALPAAAVVFLGLRTQTEAQIMQFDVPDKWRAKVQDSTLDKLTSPDGKLMKRFDRELERSLMRAISRTHGAAAECSRHLEDALHRLAEEARALLR